ncbi:hypothetical protein LPJ61_004377 [Coemansia biformis]|uniref:Thioesterase/thiol ester dehydrase-isomerase n=1 Tax=Coemansia biformis TaxID=1286918 RepID=A0A9W8CXN8_9FUNG|nr:hypothetical protein LPJ61_004377 [Coemansia biformis]
MVDDQTYVSESLWGSPVSSIVFGGQLAGLSLAAAFKTVDSSYVARSMHIQFIKCVVKVAPVTFKVQDVASGSRFISRTVQAFQNSALVMQTVCNFIMEMPPDYQADFQYQKAMPDEAAPGSSADCPYLLDPQGYPNGFPAKIWVTELDSDLTTPGPPRQRIWLESPDGQRRTAQLEQCVMAAYSDVHFIRVVVRPFGIRVIPPPAQLRKLVSIDHHVWFHQQADLGKRVFVDTWCSRLGSGRGFVQSEFFTHDGRLAATVVQEGRVDIKPEMPQPRPKL